MQLLYSLKVNVGPVKASLQSSSLWYMKVSTVIPLQWLLYLQLG